MSTINHRLARLAVGLGLTLGVGCKNPTASAPPPRPTIEDALGLWAIDTYRLDDQGCNPQPARAPLAAIEARRASTEQGAPSNAEATPEEGNKAGTEARGAAPTLELADCPDF